ncbi:hypothetical protein COCNU_scaffold002989G000010 [Cocos nucifera]|nr:hypothetical protein [Cocos nucifera]
MAKVGAPSSAGPTTTTIAFKVATSIEVVPIAEVSTVGANFMPPTSLSPSNGDQASELPTEGEMGEGKKKRKRSQRCSAMLILASHALTESGHQILTYIEEACCQEVEAQKVQEDLRVEIHHLQEKAIEAECLAEEKPTEIGSLQGILHKEEFVSVRLKAALTLEEERKTEAENKVTELEARMAKLISEAMARAMEEFKTFFEIRNLNVKFG